MQTDAVEAAAPSQPEGRMASPRPAAAAKAAASSLPSASLTSTDEPAAVRVAASPTTSTSPASVDKPAAAEAAGSTSLRSDTMDLEAELALSPGESDCELVLDLSEELTLMAIPEGGEPGESQYSRHADVKREQKKLSGVKEQGQEYENSKLEEGLAQCLEVSGGVEWLGRKLMKIAKLHLLTADQLREERYQARRRGREAAQEEMAKSSSRTELLRRVSVQPERVGVVSPEEYQVMPNLVTVGGELYNLSIKFERASVTPSINSTPGPSRDEPEPAPAPPAKKPAAPRRKRPRVYKTPEFIELSDSSDSD